MSSVIDSKPVSRKRPDGSVIKVMPFESISKAPVAFFAYPNMPSTLLPEGGEVVKSIDRRRTDARQLGGVGAVVAARIESGTGLETRVTVLGHLQRGGTPTAFDRVLATRYGLLAAELVAEGRFGQMAALRGGEVVPVPLSDAVRELRTVPREIYELTRALTD